MLRHGADRGSYYLVMVPVSEQETGELEGIQGSAPLAIRMGAVRLLPLPLEPEARAGTVGKSLYDPAGGWTATVALMRFK